MKAIITGSTGMVGKSVLLECLQDERVQSVLVINRSSLQLEHPKLAEVIHGDLLNLDPIKTQLAGYDACFHCMGVSAVGMSEKDYTRYTYELTAGLASVLYELSPGMTFNYVSGTGSDETEKGKIMWARVKGKTENMVLSKGFKDAYVFRLGALIPSRGEKSKTGWVNTLVKLMRPFYPLLKKMKSITTSEKLGRAMINAVLMPTEVKRLENRDINALAMRS
jgi:dTDP-4-dehydrorhamnose reductase